MRFIQRYGLWISLILAAAAALSFASVISSKGAPTEVQVLGPDWYGEIIVTEPDLLADLGMAALEDVDRPLAGPVSPGTGYLLNRGYREEGTFIPFDRVMYYTDPSGGPGFVYYLEIVNGSGPYDGHWYRATEAGGEAMSTVLEAKILNDSGGSSGVGRGQLEGRGNMPLWPVSGVTGILLGLALARWRWKSG